MTVPEVTPLLVTPYTSLLLMFGVAGMVPEIPGADCM